MKFHKFRKLVAEHPWMLELVDTFGYLRHDVDTSSVLEKITPKLRDFVRQQVEYIAFRPFDPEILDQVRGDYETTLTAAYALRTEEYLGGDPRTEYREEWSLWFDHWKKSLTSIDCLEGMTLLETILHYAVEDVRLCQRINHVSYVSCKFSEKLHGAQIRFWYEIYEIPVQFQCITQTAMSRSPVEMSESELLEWRRGVNLSSVETV